MGGQAMHHLFISTPRKTEGGRVCLSENFEAAYEK